MNKNNPLYTTVTLSDFQDAKYINELISLNIGMELALLTPIPAQPDPTQCKEELLALKKEIGAFKEAFEKFKIPCNEIRIHQPGGYPHIPDLPRRLAHKLEITHISRSAQI